MLTQAFAAKFLQLSSRRDHLLFGQPHGGICPPHAGCENSTPSHGRNAKGKGRLAAALCRSFEKERRQDRQRPTLRVPTEGGVAGSGEPEAHHCPSRGLRNPSANAELKRIGGRGERRSRERTKAGNRN